MSNTAPRLESARVARLGFLGVGWIGLSRMRAVVQAGAAEVACIADAAPESVARAAQAALTAAQPPRTVASLEELLEEELDGLVIATPSGHHAPPRCPCDALPRARADLRIRLVRVRRAPVR